MGAADDAALTAVCPEISIFVSTMRCAQLNPAGAMLALCYPGIGLSVALYAVKLRNVYNPSKIVLELAKHRCLFEVAKPETDIA